MVAPVRLLLIVAAACSLSACAWVRSWWQEDVPVGGPEPVAGQQPEVPPASIDPVAPALPEGSGQAVLVRPKPKLADRLRLPEMENLPNENDLRTAKQAGDGSGGGVIVRPPSE